MNYNLNKIKYNAWIICEAVSNVIAVTIMEQVYGASFSFHVE